MMAMVAAACYECYYIQRYALLATPTHAAIGTTLNRSPLFGVGDPLSLAGTLAIEHAASLPGFVRAACSYVVRPSPTSPHQ